MGEKTEKATPKKLRDARKKGQVAKSQDLPAAFTFMASVFITLALLPFIFDKVSTFLISSLQIAQLDNPVRYIPNLFLEGGYVIFLVSIPILGLVATVGVVINFLAIGPVFAIEAFKPDIKKFNPVTNLKQKFKIKTLIELLKSLFKISVAGYIVYTVIYGAIPTLVHTLSIPMAAALLVFDSFLKEVVWKVGLFFIIVAVADFLYQRHNFAKEMKMEKFEVKQEYKNTEGDPQIKGQRKQIAREIAYSEGEAEAVMKSQVIITNPIHIAVVLAYNGEVDAAPYILAMGNGLIAERIIKFAKYYDKPILRNINLAHQLWESGEVYEYVPEHTYGALAEIIKWLAKLEAGEQEPYLETDIS